VGPTRILPFLYLGSQQDALSQDIVQVSIEIQEMGKLKHTGNGKIKTYRKWENENIQEIGKLKHTVN